MSKKTKILVEHSGIGNDIHVAPSQCNRRDESPAQYAARVLAQREYGKRGEAWYVRETSRNEDGNVLEYDAFIGRRVANGFSGHNVWFNVIIDWGEE